MQGESKGQKKGRGGRGALKVGMVGRKTLMEVTVRWLGVLG